MNRPLAALLFALAAASVVSAQTAPASTQPGAPSAAGAEPSQPGAALPPVPDLVSRLRDLHPSQPAAYFLLAEEVAAEATKPEHKRLARTLYILAMSLQPDPAAADITPSVCLGLADLAVTPEEGRWLRAMADSLTRRDRLEPNWSPPGPEASPARAALDLATAIGLIRAGEGARAAPLFEQPAVQALLEKLEFTLNASGMTVTELRRNLDLWRHCPECFQHGLNQRVISRPNGFILCPTCGGNPGPVLTRDQLIGQLRFESLLLDGVNRSWSAQALVDGGSPLRDLEPGELPGAFGVDPARPFWRDGGWVTDPAVSSRPPANAEPAPEDDSDTPEPEAAPIDTPPEQAPAADPDPVPETPGDPLSSDPAPNRAG
jgi:hypothetical protein